MGIIQNIEFELNKAELIGTLGIDTDDEDDVAIFAQLFEQSLQVGNPKILYKESEVQSAADGVVVIDGVEFVSCALSRNMAGVSRCYPYVVTCGDEMDQITLPEVSAVTEYWRDEIKNRLLMSARKYLNVSIAENHRLNKFVSMAPGSADVDVWVVDEQKKLFSLFEGYGREIGVELNDSCLMTPNKSLSGIIFEAENEYLSCQLCQRDGCPDRKIGFDASLYSIMRK